MTQYDERNISMVMDLYEMTMANGYFTSGEASDPVTFDVFYRKNPDGGGFAIFAGLEQVLDYLATFRFRGSVSAMPEGTIMYPNEPILTVNAPLIDAQLVETAILTQINHQSLVATKARRIVRAAQTARPQCLPGKCLISGQRDDGS